VSFADGPPPGEGSDTEAGNAKGDISAPKKPAEIDPDDLLDEEFGPTKTKPKKGKKGKGKNVTKDEDEEIEEAPETSESICVPFSTALCPDPSHDRNKLLPLRKNPSKSPRRRPLPQMLLRMPRIQAQSCYRRRIRRN
jgi:hypothetical protein